MTRIADGGTRTTGGGVSGTPSYFRTDDVERRIRDVQCPQCAHHFRLTWNDYDGQRATLELRGCPSGGIYDVRIRCPACNYTEDL